MQGTTDRRRHRRFDTGSVTARVAIIDSGERGLRLGACTLLDVSYGGMCFTADQPLAKNVEHRFLIDLDAPFCDVVLVKARVVWTRIDEQGRQQVGAEFLESSKGWLGPDEDEFE